MIDWNSVANEAAELLSGYLKIKSVNPPGDERETGAFLSGHLRQRNLESTLYSSAPNRLNLVARLRGDGTKKPILLYNHMDVVEADLAVGRVIPLAAKSGMAMSGAVARST